MEERVREKAVKAISDILKTAGYEVHHAAPPLDLSAMKKGTILVVLCSDDRSEIDQFSQTEYSVKTDAGDQSCLKLLLTFDPSIEVGQCMVWYPEDFARYAGEAVLARVVDKQIDLESQGLSGKTAAGTDIFGASGQGTPRVPHLPIRITREEAENKAGTAGGG